MNRLKTFGHVLAIGGLAACGDVSSPPAGVEAFGERAPQLLGAMDPAELGSPSALSAASHAKAYQVVRDLFASSAASHSYPGVQAKDDITAPISLGETLVDLESGTFLNATLTATLLGEYCDEQGGVDSSFLLSGPATLGDEQGLLSLRMSVKTFTPATFELNDISDALGFDLVTLEILEEAFVDDSQALSSDDEGTDDTAEADGDVDLGADIADAPALAGNDLVGTGLADAPALAGNDAVGAGLPDAPALAGNDAVGAGLPDAPALAGNDLVGTGLADAPALAGNDLLGTGLADAPALAGNDAVGAGLADAPALAGNDAVGTGLADAPALAGNDAVGTGLADAPALAGNDAVGAGLPDAPALAGNDAVGAGLPDAPALAGNDLAPTDFVEAAAPIEATDAGTGAGNADADSAAAGKPVDLSGLSLAGAPAPTIIPTNSTGTADASILSTADVSAPTSAPAMASPDQASPTPSLSDWQPQ